MGTVLIILGALACMILVVSVAAQNPRAIAEEEAKDVSHETTEELRRNTQEPPETEEEREKREEEEAYDAK